VVLKINPVGVFPERLDLWPVRQSLHDIVCPKCRYSMNSGFWPAVTGSPCVRARPLRQRQLTVRMRAAACRPGSEIDDVQDA
jgi:hypothetical protein